MRKSKPRPRGKSGKQPAVTDLSPKHSSAVKGGTTTRYSEIVITKSGDKSTPILNN